MNNNCNFQITTIKLKNLSRNTFESDLRKTMDGKGKFLYKIYLNEELCRMIPGFSNGVPVYIGQTTDIIDRIYRHFKGMCPEFSYHPNMEKGRRLYAIMTGHGFNVPNIILENLYQYIEVDVDDLTETDVDLECYEAENLEAFKNRHGSIPVLNIREEKTTNVNKALTRKFFIEEEVSE